MGSSLLDIFFGSTQSSITAYAILAAIIAICITILLTRTDMNMGNRFLLIFFVILSLVPSVFLILFEITCMVTGGNSKERWWCWAYAWIIAAFIIIYCILIIIISLSSLFTYNNAIEKVEVHELQNKMSPDNSNEYAKKIIETRDEVEKFELQQRNYQQIALEAEQRAIEAQKQAIEAQKKAINDQEAQPAQPAQPAQSAQSKAQPATKPATFEPFFANDNYASF